MLHDIKHFVCLLNHTVFMYKSPDLFNCQVKIF